MFQSPLQFPTLNYDYETVAQFLASAPTNDTQFGRRASISKGDLIIGLAPVYAELAALLRALAIHLSLPSVPRFGNPFPTPFLATSKHLAGQLIPTSSWLTLCLDIQTGVISEVISTGPCLIFTLDGQGEVVDALPLNDAKADDSDNTVEF